MSCPQGTGPDVLCLLGCVRRWLVIGEVMEAPLREDSKWN